MKDLIVLIVFTFIVLAGAALGSWQESVAAEVFRFVMIAVTCSE